MISEDKPMILNTLNIKKGSIICLFFVLFFYGCGPSTNKKVDEHKLEGNALGTTYHITYLGEEIPNLQNSIDSILVEFNYGVSTYDTNSFISHYNNLKPLRIIDLKPGYQYLGKMITLSQPIVEATYGAFDPSAAKLFSLYDASKRGNRLMDRDQVFIALNDKGLKHIEFGSDSLMRNVHGKQMNFNAIAKGYFVDLLASFIEINHISNYMVEVGGEVHCSGKSGSGEPWKIGINRPVVEADPSDYFEVIALSDMSMATSGNYKNFYEVDGKVIGHTLDPRTGQPVISSLKSATIIHKDCAVADAYATACMVLGLEASITLIEKDSSLSGYFIYQVDDKLVGLHVR